MSPHTTGQRGDLYHDGFNDDGYVHTGSHGWVWCCKGNPLTQPEMVAAALLAIQPAMVAVGCSGCVACKAEVTRLYEERGAARAERDRLKSLLLAMARSDSSHCEKCGSSGLTRYGTQGASKCETLCQGCARLRAGLPEHFPPERSSTCARLRSLHLPTDPAIVAEVLKGLPAAVKAFGDNARQERSAPSAPCPCCEGYLAPHATDCPNRVEYVRRPSLMTRLGGLRGLLCGAASTACAVSVAVALVPEAFSFIDVSRSLVVLLGALFGGCVWAIVKETRN